METSFKSSSFVFVFWIMIVFLTGDALDTVYRFVIIGYFGDGVTFPGTNTVIKPDTLDLVIFLIAHIFIIYGIYLLYNLKRRGGYFFLGSNVFFLVYASFFGPVAEVGFSNIFTPIVFYFSLYVFFALCVPRFYAERFSF